MLGTAPVQFQGAPDFSPVRTLRPASRPKAFPPLSFSVGATARAGYSPYVRVAGSPIVFNAPIVATGDGPFDVTTHTNTHDRTLGIDMQRMTTDQLFVRGFANGRSIAYLSFDSSDAFTATVERSIFVPALADLQFANGGDGPARTDRPDSARASIFTFVNARTGLETSPPPRGATQGRGRSQGLTHALSLPIVGRDAAVANPDVLEALRRGADVSNIFSDMPRDFGNSRARQYSPAWGPAGRCVQPLRGGQGPERAEDRRGRRTPPGGATPRHRPGWPPAGLGEHRHQLPRAGLPRPPRVGPRRWAGRMANEGRAS